MRSCTRFGPPAVALLAVSMAGCGGEAGREEAARAEASVEETAGALLNPNLAGEEELAAIEGLPEPALAAILEGRPFLDMASLDAALAPHIGLGPRSALYRAMWVPIDLNTASEAEILLIPDVGERMAHEFEEYRPYDGIARFRREIGKYVDEEQVEAWVPYVFLPIDLNTASEDEILAIPGVGDRLLGEFLEYRPYASMEQFRREIGKYVDDGELARLSRFVTLSEN